MKKLIGVIFIAGLMIGCLSGCSGSGSRYVGEWSEIDKPEEHISITATREGQYCWQRGNQVYPAFYKQGSLLLDSPVGQASAYIDDNSHLVINFLGEPWGVYQRIN